MKNGEQKNQDCKLILTRVKSRPPFTLVLPVIQRRLVWNEEEMELIFDP